MRPEISNADQSAAEREAAGHLIELALAEDVGPGDLTGEWFLPQGLRGEVVVVARESGVLAGVEICAEVFQRVDSQIESQFLARDGSGLQPGQAVLHLRGPVRSLLTAERTALNFLQHLSGIASLTAEYVRLLKGTRARLLDTRKTLPGWRLLEKAAVRAGGGHNHRLGLYDRVMLKDNHLAAFSDLAALQRRVVEFRQQHPGIKVEIEADTFEQAGTFLAWPGVDVVLLDNMSLEELRACVALRRAPVELEASGGITRDNLRAVAETGVDWISVGAITHSARALDFGLDWLCSSSVDA
jgi:nicotinate-nucleotide pyrophosphorylase (carboxylating)